MNKKEQILPLIIQGYTMPEIMRKLGYKSNDLIYSVAKENGLKVKKPTEKRAELIKAMRAEGKDVKEIADILKITDSSVWSIMKRESIPLPSEQKEKRNCKICGAVFEAPQNRQQFYCNLKCQRIANRIPKAQPDEQNAIRLIAKHADDWEYIGGYTGSEGHMIIRHKACGFTTRKSTVTIRQCGKLQCMICEAAERKKRKEAKQRAKEAERFRKIKPVHYEQESTKACAVCNGFFYGAGKYCSKECSHEVTKHYWNMKKRRRAKLAHTEESKTISLRKLYERDAGVCWICGKPCDYSADPNSDYYPSVDHVLEIANGGRDEWSNIKLAHRLCNSQRWFKESPKAEPVGISPRLANAVA